MVKRYKLQITLLARPRIISIIAISSGVFLTVFYSIIALVNVHNNDKALVSFKGRWTS